MGPAPGSERSQERCRGQAEPAQSQDAGLASEGKVHPGISTQEVQVSAAHLLMLPLG